MRPKPFIPTLVLARGIVARRASRVDVVDRSRAFE
jgi:hypothetical protein